MNNKLILKSIVSAFIITLFFASCDKDYNEIGTDVIGGDHFDFEKYTDATVSAFNQGTGFVQTNNLKLNSLGILNNPVFGNTVSSFATQVQLPSGSVTTFGANVVVDSVYLAVPYFSTKGTTATDGSSKYELDSIYGKSSGKIKLSVFESGYYINNYDPSPEANFESELKFYNNDQQLFESNKKGAAADGTSISGGTRLNNSADATQNDAFVFSPKEIITVDRGDNDEIDDKDVRTRIAPAMRLRLNSTFFKKKIMDASEDKLSNNNSFKDYFRGLYFKVEKADDNGRLAMMDFTKGTVTISYTEDLVKVVNNVNVTTRVHKSFVINMGGNKVSLQDQSSPGAAYATAIMNNTPDTPTGDDRLFLKGGEGSLAIIDLFGRDATGNGATDELKALRAKGWLINEANLTFYIDNAGMMAGTDSIPEPQRIYLYDLTNKRQLYDYSTDASSNSNPKFNKSIFGGLIEREKVAHGRGIKYKIRITNHIRNLIRNDSTNVRLGLVVTESIAEVTNLKLKTPSKVDRIPAASVMDPLGTILWGNTPAAPEGKRLKLEIYYTKPN